MTLLRNYLFKIGEFEIKIYAVCILTGALLAYFLGKKWAKHLGIAGEIIDTGFFWGLIIGVLGSRLYYVIFNDFNHFITQPWTLFTEFRNGGLAISGAVIGAGIWVFFYCRKIKIHPLYIAELVALGFFIGQIIGRWGNFFNQEAHGWVVPGETLEEQRQWLSWLPDFIVDNMLINGNYYHPTFLYEGLANTVGLVTILLVRKFWKNYWVGDGALFYFTWYGFVRTHIEILRTDAQMVGPIKVAQLTWLIMFVCGVACFILRRIFKYKVAYWYDPQNILNSFNVKKEAVSEGTIESTNVTNETNVSNETNVTNVTLVTEETTVTEESTVTEEENKDTSNE